MMNDRSYLRTLSDRELIELALAGNNTELAIVLAERLEEVLSNFSIYGDNA